MAMTGKERAALRAEAHHLTPLVHVGQQGISPALVRTLDDALRTHELVKVQLGRHAERGARETAQALAEATASEVVQVIGKTLTLYRENQELERKPGEPPPWR
jgi:RNA-binding protein